MRNNYSLDGTPMQRAPRRRTTPAPHERLFTDSELDHLTRPPTPLAQKVSSLRPTIIRSLRRFGGLLWRLARTIIQRMPAVFAWLRRVFHFILLRTQHAFRGLTRRYPTLRQLHRPTWLSRRRAIILAVSLGLIIAYALSRPHASPQSGTTPAIPYSSSGQAPPATLPKGNPDYDTLLPPDHTIDQLGGWTRVSPASSDPVYAYTDRIDTTSIIVSQQPLPASFRDNPSQKLKDLATSYSAGEHLVVDDIDVYIAKSSNGQQSAILTKKGLLIFIKASGAIDHGKLLQYIRDLT